MFDERELFIERFKSQFVGSLFYWLFLDANRPSTYMILSIHCSCNLFLQTFGCTTSILHWFPMYDLFFGLMK